MDLLCDAPTTVVLTPDTTSEQALLPEPASLQACLLLADRGYLDLHYRQRVVQQGGCFLIRAKAGMNPQLVEAFRDDGKRLRSLRNTPLQALHAKLPKRQRVELVVRWQVDGHPLCLRLILSWHGRTKSFCYLLTNLSPQRYPLDTICRAYKWRWHVEEAFRDLKSSRFGLSLEYSGTHHLERLQVLLLLASLALWVLWLLGKAAELTEQHRPYQVNTVRKRAVLSTIFIGLQVIGDPRVTLRKAHIRAATCALRDIVQAPMSDY